MTTPKKPPTKTESAIQLGNMYRFMARGSGRKLKKIGEKPSKVSKTKKIGEVQTRPKKSLQNQKHGPVHPGLGGKMVDKKPPDASLQRAINEWKKNKGKK